VSDTLTASRRSALMSRVRTRDTGPEMQVRRLLTRLGYRYRLHDRHLPGRPDLVFRSRSSVVFVHGCFWHGHDCRAGRLPKTRTDFWSAKQLANRSRDARQVAELVDAGWQVAVVWECELSDEEALLSRLVDFLGPARRSDSSHDVDPEQIQGLARVSPSG